MCTEQWIIPSPVYVPIYLPKRVEMSFQSQIYGPTEYWFQRIQSTWYSFSRPNGSLRTNKLVTKTIEALKDRFHIKDDSAPTKKSDRKNHPPMAYCPDFVTDHPHHHLGLAVWQSRSTKPKPSNRKCSWSFIFTDCCVVTILLTVTEEDSSPLSGSNSLCSLALNCHVSY